MGKILDLLKRKPPKVDMVGQELHIQPTTAKKQERSLARIERLQGLVAGGAPKSYKQELDRRVKALKKQGITIPPYKGA